MCSVGRDVITTGVLISDLGFDDIFNHTSSTGLHNTHQFLLHTLMFDSVDEWIHADVDIGQKHCGVVSAKEDRCCRKVDEEEINVTGSETDDKRDADDDHCFDDVPLGSFGLKL